MLCILYVILSAILFLAFLALVVGIIFSKEVDAALDRDPAARSRWEIIFLYSGFHAMVTYRITHRLLKMHIPFLPRLLSQIARFLTGIEIHPGATIGNGLFIDHGMGVVIGETSILGDNITLYQGVTLGGTGKEKGKRHPTIGNNVVVGTGAKILGNINIGDNSYVGANAVVIKDVPPNSTVVGVPGRITKQDGKKIDIDLDHIHVIDPLMQSIEELEKRIERLEKNK